MCVISINLSSPRCVSPFRVLPCLIHGVPLCSCDLTLPCCLLCVYSPYIDTVFRFAVAFNQPLNSWSVASVTNMVMSEFCVSSVSISRPPPPCLPFVCCPLSFKVSHCAHVISPPCCLFSYIDTVFRHAQAFNQPLLLWNVTSVTSMFTMFGSTNDFNQPLHSWNVASVTDMYTSELCDVSFEERIRVALRGGCPLLASSPSR